MEVLKVTVSAPVVSFRRPLDHNFQRTLPLPPPTTLLGLAGAALGLSDRELWEAGSPTYSLKVAVLSWCEPGKAKDMWTVMKIKTGKIAERSPYFRELLFFHRLSLIYGGDIDILRMLKTAFEDPVYPLSLGREDELIKIEEVGLVEVSSGIPRFRGTVIPEDIKKLNLNIDLREGIRFEPPVVEVLPLRFELDAKGIRAPKEKRAFSFIPYSLELTIQGIQPVFSLEGRNFTWMNF